MDATAPPSFEDWLAIVTALNRLGEIFDRREWHAVGEVIAADAVCYGVRGRDAIVSANLRHHLGGCRPSQHLLGNYMVMIDGDSARSRTKVRAFHQGAGDRAHLTFESIGVYHDTWSRTATGWLLVERVFQVDTNIGDFSALAPG
ncbi:MAG TPA: nuclear transport factor 2 family protein [Acidimicrobiales bacterium]|jgi:hypothetical protein|nr:nuclear transport factor 2 family protein [Acidimicrobiales bacterium]